MTSSLTARLSLRGRPAPARQLGFTWLAGSLTMGTVSALFLAVGRTQLPLPPLKPVPFRPASLGPRGVAVPGIDVVKPLAGLPVLAITAVILLVLVLFAALAVIAWYTSGASWLPPGARGYLWWTILTGGLGLAAWFFAATVTFGANFGPAWQAVLGYAGGGLPFALVAALLQASRVANLAAGGASVGLVVLGFVLVATHDRYDPNALSLSYDYLRYLFGRPAGAGAPGPIPTGGPPTAYP